MARTGTSRTSTSLRSTMSTLMPVSATISVRGNICRMRTALAGRSKATGSLGTKLGSTHLCASGSNGMATCLCISKVANVRCHGNTKCTSTSASTNELMITLPTGMRGRGMGMAARDKRTRLLLGLSLGSTMGRRVGGSSLRSGLGSTGTLGRGGCADRSFTKLASTVTATRDILTSGITFRSRVATTRATLSATATNLMVGRRMGTERRLSRTISSTGGGCTRTGCAGSDCRGLGSTVGRTRRMLTGSSTATSRVGRRIRGLSGTIGTLIHLSSMMSGSRLGNCVRSTLAGAGSNACASGD